MKYLILGAVSRFTVRNISDTTISFLPSHRYFRNSPNSDTMKEKNRINPDTTKTKVFLFLCILQWPHVHCSIKLCRRCITYLLFSLIKQIAISEEKKQHQQTNNVPKSLSKPVSSLPKYITADDDDDPPRDSNVKKKFHNNSFLALSSARQGRPRICPGNSLLFKLLLFSQGCNSENCYDKQLMTHV